MPCTKLHCPRENELTTKNTGRLNLQFEDFDTEQELKQLYNQALERKKVANACLAQEKIITEDLLQIYPNMVMADGIKERIRKLVESDRLNLNRYPREGLLQTLVIEVEAYYIYSLMKSVLVTQEDDDIIRPLLHKHNVKTFKIADPDVEPLIQDKFEV
jgi:heme oxygenase